MTEEQAATLIAYAYSNGEQINAIGAIQGQAINWQIVIAILLVILVYLFATRRG